MSVNTFRLHPLRMCYLGVAREQQSPSFLQVRAPMPPAYMFVIDVSVSAVACGMLAAVVEGIKTALDALAENERTMVGFLTFDSTLHFYSLKASLTQPQMLVRGGLCCVSACSACIQDQLW